jgi:hypothetical protein
MVASQRKKKASKLAGAESSYITELLAMTAGNESRGVSCMLCGQARLELGRSSYCVCALCIRVSKCFFFLVDL